MSGWRRREAAFEAAEQALAQRQVELGDVASRLGDRERFRSFDRLVQQQEQESKALDAAREDVEQAERAAVTAVALVESRGVELEAAVAALAGATDAEAAGARSVEEARAALAVGTTRRDGPRAPRIARRRRAVPGLRAAGHVDPEGTRGAQGHGRGPSGGEGRGIAREGA